MSGRTGCCLCGAVQYQISAEPLAVRICWCRDCQHLAANGSVNVLVPSASLTVNGALGEYVSTADSGNRMTRRFCPTCGSHLFANSSARPQVTVVRAGTLDDPSTVFPTANIWCRSAPVWACMDGRLDRVEGQPPAPQGPGK